MKIFYFNASFATTLQTRNRDNRIGTYEFKYDANR